MRPKEVTAFLKSSVHYPDMPAVFIWGPPGVGKSDVNWTVAKEEGISLIDFRLSLNDPTDLKGVPFPVFEKGCTQWL